MSIKSGELPTSLSNALAQRFRDLAGNAAILCLVAFLTLTTCVLVIAGLVALLSPIWGLAATLMAMGLVTAISALALLVWLQRKAQLQRLRARVRQDVMRSQGEAALVAALPSLIRNRSGALVIISGLAIGATIAAALKADDEL